MEIYSTMKTIFIDLINQSCLKNEIIFEEKEQYSSKIEKSYKILGRVSKTKENQLKIFKQEFYNSLFAKVGASFVTENFDSVWQVTCGISIGDTLPNLELFALNGNNVNYKVDSDKLTLIDFWNINCQYCKPLMEKYVRLYEKKKDENKFVIVGISNDKNSQDWKKFVANQKWHTIPQYVKSGITDSLGIVGVPFIIIVEKNDQIIYADRAYKIDVESTLDKQEIVYLSEYSIEEIGNKSFFLKNENERIKIIEEINDIFKLDGLNDIKFSVSIKNSYNNHKEIIKVIAKLSGSRFKFDEEKFQNIFERIQNKYKFIDIEQDIKVSESFVIDVNEDF